MMVNYNKNQLIDIAKRLVDPVLNYRNAAGTELKQEVEAHYDNQVRSLEAFARILYAIGPILVNEDCEKYKVFIKENITQGTNPESECYWGIVEDGDQRQVEMVPIIFTLFITKNKIFNEFSDIEKERVNQWFLQINNCECMENNWVFFHILVNLFLSKLNLKYSKEAIERYLKIVDKNYLGNGWYSDGIGGNIDYYNPFAMHFYSLLYVKYSDDYKRANIFLERAKLFAKNYIYWFSKDGSSIPYGRSLIYRFAQSCFWSAMALNNIMVFDKGVIKGLIFENLNFWLRKDIFDNVGILNLGYCYSNQYITESYNSSASVFWALKIFIILLVDEDGFWSEVPCCLPELDEKHTDKIGGYTICRSQESDIVALFPNRNSNCFWTQCSNKYMKFFYSNKYGFNVCRENNGISNYGGDSSLIFSEDNKLFNFRNEILNSAVNEEYHYSEWKAGTIATVQSFIIPEFPTHVRIHKIKTDRECYMYEMGATIGKEGVEKLQYVEDMEYIRIFNQKYYSSIESLIGNGQAKLVENTVNTNIISPKSSTPALVWKLKPGEYVIASKVSFGRLDDAETEVSCLEMEKEIVNIVLNCSNIEIDLKGYKRPKKNYYAILRKKLVSIFKFLKR